MLEYIGLNNVGPSPKMHLDFGRRLNLLTGDNGLGKSFILDVAWWALTRKWPAEINPKISGGLPAKPRDVEGPFIEYGIKVNDKIANRAIHFSNELQKWQNYKMQLSANSIVLYAQADGSFSCWDPVRNAPISRQLKEAAIEELIDIRGERPPGFVFNPSEIWNGLKDEEYGLLCNGLIIDWAGWQKENGRAFHTLINVLESLSPSNDEIIRPGEFSSIAINDPRDIPTIRMYGQETPILHASAGIRRIAALAYLLVWNWEQHLRASKVVNMPPVHNIVFLIDEIEAHLHPKWQRKILSALLSVARNLSDSLNVQLITATHSPLVLASAEPLFDPNTDAWFDLDLNTDKKRPVIQLQKLEFVPHGDVSNWLMSEAFDLESARSFEAENLINKAATLLGSQNPGKSKIKNMHEQLVKHLSPKDPFLFRWRAIIDKRGLLE